MAYTEFDGDLDGDEPSYTEFNGELDKPESKLDKVKSFVSKGVDAGLDMLTPKKSIANQAQTQPVATADPARIKRNNQIGLNAFTSTQPVPEEGGFLSSAGRTVGQGIKGAGQVAADYLGANPNNAAKQYGQAVIDANPTAVNSMEDIAAKPGTAVAEGVGNAAPSMAGMIGARAVGQGITALSPLAGPAAPLVAAAGQVVSWLGPAAIAALPSYGGIRDKQILNDPKNEKDAKSIAIATMGAAAVAGIETAFGPQNWALAAMTKQGRAKMAEKFASTTLAGSAGKAAFKGAGVEGSEELVQSPIEQMASYDNPTTKESLKETGFGVMMGALTGGVLGGGTGMILGRPATQQSDGVLKYTAERGGAKAKDIAKAEIERRAKEGVNPAVANAPESTPDAVQRIIETGKDKARDVKKDSATASESIESDIFDDDSEGTGGAVADKPTPEPVETLNAQVAALAEGRKPGVLLTPGEPLPNTLPEGVKSADIPDRGTLLYRDDDTLKAAKNGQMGTALGYGIDEKPPGATHAVTSRDENGTVIQDVATDGNNSVLQAAKDVAGPSGTVEVRPIEHAMAERGQNSAKVVLPDNTHLPAQWDVVDADSVSASLKQGVNQPRDRSRAASDIQVQGISNNPDYHRLSDSPVMDVGAPTLSNDGAIVGGNGRFEGISRSYDQGKAGNYLASLKADAATKGIDPAKIDGMKKPVLVRRITQPFDTRKLAVASNSGTSLQYSGLELAKIDAERMKGLADLEVLDTGEIALTGSNLQNVRHALGDYSAAELGALTDKDGMLSQEGVRRIRNAMLYAAYGSNPTLERLVESTDNDMRNISGALVRAAGSAAKVRADIKAGSIPADMDISEDLVSAVETLSKIKSQGMSVDEHLAQIGMFGDDLSEPAKQILRVLESNMRSQKKIAEFVKSYYDAVSKLDLASGDMFGNSTPSKAGLLNDSKDKITEKPLPIQDLFARPASALRAESGQKSPDNGGTTTSSEKDKQVSKPSAPPKAETAPPTDARKTAEDRWKEIKSKWGSSQPGKVWKPSTPLEIRVEAEKLRALLTKGNKEYIPPAEKPDPDTKEETTPKPKPAELTGARPLVESLIKRRAAAKESEKEHVIDEAITNAHAYLKTGKGDAAYFRKAASRFNDDHATRDILRSLADDVAKTNPEAAKVKTEPLSVEEKAKRAPVLAEAKKLGIKTVARKFSEIEKDIARLHELKHEGQVNGLTDDEYQAYDDKVMDLQDEIDNDDATRAALDEVGKAHKDKSTRAYYEALIKHFEGMVNESKGSEAGSGKAGTESNEEGRGVEGKSGTEKTDTKSTATGQSVQEVKNDAPYLQLLGLKSTKLLTTSGGRAIHAVSVSPAFRNKYFTTGRGSVPVAQSPSFELKLKSDVTGVPQDSGYLLIDKREQNKARISPKKAGLSVQEVENHISPLQQAGTKKIKVAATEADLPANIQDAIKSAGVSGVRGVYYPQTDEVWLVADKLNTADEAIMVALHEARHRGLRKLFGDGVAPIMRQIYGTNKRVRDAANRMMQSNKGMSKEEATEEVLADMALDGTAHELNGWKRLVQHIQKWLADHGIKLKFTDAMVESLVAGAETVGSSENGNVASDDTPRFSRTPQVGQNASWNAPEPSKMDNLIYKMQNKHVDLKRVIEEIQKTSGKLADQWNTYLQEELFHERAAKRTKDFVNRELKQIIMGMTLRGQSMEEVEHFLHARHAEEANNLIASRDANMPDGGSGMTTKDAKDYLANLPADKRTALENTAKQVDAVLAKTRDLYVSYGLVDKDTADSWKNMFRHYVPLMREDHDGGMGVGQGFSIKGKEVKHRTGSKRKVVDILANIALQRERAIVRGEKNRVAVSLAGLAKLNPNPDFWTYDKVPVEKVLNESKNTIEERQVSNFKMRDNVVVAKIKDSHGKVHERAVVFNEHNERAMRMALAMKNLDATQLEGLFGVSASITHYFAAINTQYNPVFGVVNLIRDLQAVMLNLSSTPLAGRQAEVMKYIIPAIMAIYSSSRSERHGNTVNSPMANRWEELQNEGGMTGFRDLFKTSEDRANAIKRELNPTEWMDSKLGKVFTAGGTLKVPLAVAQKQATWIFDWLSDYNQTLEGAMRLAVYQVAIDHGLSKQVGSSIAKNISVNFNRKGQSGQQAGALYAFFNAAMQGTARIGETMTTMEKGDPKTFKFNKTGKQIIAGGISLGVIQALALSAAGFDDDEPPEFVRERSLIIPIGDKKYISIPMPLGFHAIPNIGRLSTEFAMGGFKKPADYTAKLFMVFAEAFNPIGTSSTLAQTISPTVTDPMLALAENKDWTGKPIAKEDFNKLSPTPGFSRNKDTASDPAKFIAEAINTISGGNKYVPGVASPTADQIDYLVGQITGGVGREAGKAQQSIKALTTGEELPPHKIPLVGRFYGNSDAQSSQGNAFYSNLKRLNEIEAELKGRRKDKLPLDEFKAENPEWRMVELANLTERTVSKQRKLKSDLIKQDAPREQVKAIEDRITKLMAGLNSRVKELKQAQQAVH